MASGQPSCALLSSVVRLCSSQSSTPCCKRCWVCSLSPQTACRCVCVLALLWVVPPRSHQVLTCLRLLQQVECFGKKINHPQVLEVLFRTLPRSPLDVRHAAMKEMNVLFVRKEENYKIFMKQRAWQTWLVPLVASIPADKEVRVLRVASVCKSRAHTCLPVCVDAGRLAPRKRQST